MEKSQKYTRDEMTDMLLIELIKEDKLLDLKQKEFILEFSRLYIKNNSYLLELYLALKNKKNFLVDEDNNVTYEFMREKCKISIKEKNAVFNTEVLLSILPFLIDICEEVLPLGSCVELKKGYFKDILDISVVENIKVIISYRFVENEDSYYTYAGVVYPVGNFNNGKLIKFTPALISKIIHKGYSDEQEDAYVYLMKKELNIEKNLMSAGLKVGGQDGDKN